MSLLQLLILLPSVLQKGSADTRAQQQLQWLEKDWLLDSLEACTLPG
jgi:hypothetical protein